MCVYRRTPPAEDRSSRDAGSLDRTLKDGIVRISTGGHPDAEVAKGTPCMYATGALEAFPEDRLLRDLEAQAWVGIPLNNTEGQICGIFAALYRQPLQTRCKR